MIVQTIGFLGLWVILSLTSCVGDSTPDDSKPNFIFIIVDDQNQELSPFGKDYIKTPNLDKLARNGMSFPYAYVQQAVCAASRASFLTGLHPEATGVEYPYSQYFVEEVIPKYGTIGQHFLNNGYHTRYFGKVHHGGFKESLSEPDYSPGGTRYVDPNNVRLDELYGNDSVPPYEVFDGPDSLFRDGRTTLTVLDAIYQASQGDAPFFFAVGFMKPHLPFSAPKRYWDLYDRETIPLVRNPNRPQGSPEIAFSRYNLNQYNWEHADPDRLFSNDYARLLRHAYFACASFIDFQIGMILDQLDALGIRENTYIVYISDHGFHLGELNHWGKTSLHEANLRSPMLIALDKMQQKGTTCNALVEYVDVLPTLMDMAGLPIPQHAEGTSMAPLLDDPNQPFKTAVFSRQERDIIGRKKGFSVRDERYRYTEWRNTTTHQVLASELYDLVADPLETKNMVSRESNREIVDRMSQKLHDGWPKTLPEWVTAAAQNPDAPPAYGYGKEGIPRRRAWHEVYGGKEEDGWKKAIELRRAKEDSIRSLF